MPQSSADVIVGRETELETLNICLDASTRGDRQIVFVAGEPGIGKTTLVDLFLKQLDAGQPIQIGQGQCVEQYGAGEAYLPLLEATTQLCRAAEGAHRVAALKQYAPMWLIQLPGLVEEQERQALQQKVQGSTHERMLREMAEALEILSANQPLVLVLEDLHWSDASTLELIGALARRRERAKLLIIGTYRPVDLLTSENPLKGIINELKVRSQCLEIPVSPLQEGAVSEYLTQRFVGAEWSPTVLQTLHHRTRGNPLFLTNIVEYLTQREVIVQHDEGWTVQNDFHAVAGDVPESLRQLIERHVDRLEETDQRVLEAASIAGAEFSVAEVAALLQTEGIETLEDQCERLAQKGQFITNQGMDEWPDGTLSERYTFQHALYQNVLYERVSDVRRIRQHRQLGERKAAAYGGRASEIATELAVHFERGRDVQQALPYYALAGQAAADRLALREAISHATKGLELLETLPDTPERAQQELGFHFTLGPTYMILEGYSSEGAGRSYIRACDLCEQSGNTQLLTYALGGLYTYYIGRGELETARQIAERDLTLAQQIGDPTSLLITQDLCGVCLLFLGELIQSVAHFAEAIALTASSPTLFLLPVIQDPGVDSAGLMGFATWVLGYPDQARQRTEDAMAYARSIDQPVGITSAFAYGAMVQRLAGAWPAVSESAEAAVALATERGFVFWLTIAKMEQAFASEEGRQAAPSALETIQSEIEQYKALRVKIHFSFYLVSLAEAYWRGGQTQQGLQILEEAFAHVEETHERLCEAELYRIKGELTLQSKVEGSECEEQAEGYFQKAIKIAQRQQSKSWELRAVMSLGRLWHSQGKTDSARQIVEDVYSWFREGFDTQDLQDAEALLKELGSTVERPDPQEGEPINLLDQFASSPQEQAEQPEQTTQPTASVSSAIEAAETSSAETNDADAIFRYEDGSWILVFEGRTCRMRDNRGLRQLAQLLLHPNQAFEAVALLADGAHDANAQAPDPASAQANEVGAESVTSNQAEGYQRLQDLQEELAEAESFNDMGRVEQIQNELDRLTQDLTQAVESKRQPPKAASAAQRARVNVTRTIRFAIKKITDNHPSLGDYLSRTIKTGATCSYIPDPDQPIDWRG